jgi:hypothetical protein
MSISMGDIVCHISANEEGEVVAVSKISPDCVMVRFGESFEYLIEKDRLALVAGEPRRTVIHR